VRPGPAPALARGEINVIGATTLAEYRKHFESDSALDRRFQPINIEEPSTEATVELLRKVAPKYAKHHDVEIDSDALAACVHQAIRFIPDRRLPDKALDLLDEACAEASLSDRSLVTAEVVAEALSERTGIPVGKLTEAERARMINIEVDLGRRVLGQAHAITHVCNTVKLSRAGLRDPGRPRGVFLFVGPSGVGKTALARSLAEFLFPEGNAFIKLDMSEYADKFTGSRLVGAPPGYSGHGEEGLLTGPLRRRPYSVVLLDEFEKAHQDVQTMFLSLFEEGTITDSEGRRVEAQEAFFIMTSNVGSETALRGRVGFGGGVEGMNRDLLLDKIREHFRPELLNRVDEVVPFHLLDDEALGQIVSLHLTELQSRSRAEGVDLTWSDEVIGQCIAARKDAAYGARPALRAIDDLVAEPLGHKLLEIGANSPRAYRAEVKDGEIIFIPQNTVQKDTNAARNTIKAPPEEEPA
jgi:ATP-dependent Clp protease ATP-binding subunit ClpC